jgi:hypothetical protein
MKFRDPLASFYFIGGTFPNHLAMAVYGGFVWGGSAGGLPDSCPEGVDLTPLLNQFYAVKLMVGAHTVYVALTSLQKVLSRQAEGFKVYVKTAIVYVTITLYLAAFFYMQLACLNELKPEVEACLRSSDSYYWRYRALRDYMRSETFIFYSSFLALFIYINFAKLLYFLKERWHEVNQNDPFQMLIASSQDFLGHDNFIMLSLHQ